MLQVGRFTSPLAAVESRTHFGAWCIVSSPLILGFDLTNSSVMAAVLPYVANPEAVAVNQAWEGDPGRLLQGVGQGQGFEVWAKHQPEGALALLAINTDAKKSANVSLDLSQVSRVTWCGGGCTVRDVWRREDMPRTKGPVLDLGSVGPHDSAFVVVASS